MHSKYNPTEPLYKATQFLGLRGHRLDISGAVFFVKVRPYRCRIFNPYRWPLYSDFPFLELCGYCLGLVVLKVLQKP